MIKEEIVMEDSPEAASYRTGIEGWVSRDGRFFGKDERTARYAGSTHRKCDDCGSVVRRGYLICDGCRDKKIAAKFKMLERKPWDGETPLCIYDSDIYFFCEEEIDDYCEEHGVEKSNLHLVFCVPQYPHQIDFDDIVRDDLPDEVEPTEVLNKEVLAAMEKLNSAIKQSKPISWCCGNVAVILEP